MPAYRYSLESGRHILVIRDTREAAHEAATEFAHDEGETLPVDFVEELKALDDEIFLLHG